MDTRRALNRLQLRLGAMIVAAIVGPFVALIALPFLGMSPWVQVPASGLSLIVTSVVVKHCIRQLVEAARLLPLRLEGEPLDPTNPTVTQTELDRLQRFDNLSDTQRGGVSGRMVILSMGVAALTLLTPTWVGLCLGLVFLGAIIPVLVHSLCQDLVRFQQKFDEAKYYPGYWRPTKALVRVLCPLLVGANAIVIMVALLADPVVAMLLLMGSVLGYFVGRPQHDAYQQEFDAVIEGRSR